MSSTRPFRLATLFAFLALLTAACTGGRETANASRSSGQSQITTSTATIEPLPPSTVAAPAEATVTQPAQPTSGPGSSALAHHDWSVHSGGTGPNAWYVFEPAAPKPRNAPLTIVMHGYYEFSGYATMHEFIRHTVLAGSIVIYPRWQTGVSNPCPGPFDPEPCLQAALAGIRGALAFLESDVANVQPDLDHTRYFGLSFGGILTANMANRWSELNLPKPQAILLDDPHDGGLDGAGEPSFDDSMDDIPSTTLIVCHIGVEGVMADDPTGACNALFPKLGHIPPSRRAIVLTTTDAHGLPTLSSKHGVCAAPPGWANAYDWNVCWRIWDELGDRIEHKNPSLPDHKWLAGNGSWSDGTAIAPLKVRSSAPIES